MEELNTALDFTSFVLRYNAETNYEDFSENPEVIEKIKRGEKFRSWGDIEDLGNTQEELSKTFNEHEKTVGNAFQELYNHIEKVKEHVLEKVQENKEENKRLNNYLENVRDNQKGYHPSSDSEPPKSAKGTVNNVNKVFEAFDKKMDEIELFINEKVVKRIELLEQHEEDFGDKINTVVNKVKIQIDKSSKIEEQLKEHLDIISTVNK